MGKFKAFMRWYLNFDIKDIWNYILLALAILILWWGIKNIIAGLQFAQIP